MEPEKENKNLSALSEEQLEAGLKKHRDELCDLEDVHKFTFQKTQVHISAENAFNMQAEFEEECRQYREHIALMEKELVSRRGAL